MSNILENLQKILSSRYGRDVRQAIHDGILNCYEDGKAGAIDLEAREDIETINSDIEDINSDLADKQNKSDANLTTNSKQIVGAVNELNQNLTPKSLGASNDLNEMLETGYYVCSGQSPANSPSSSSLLGSLTIYQNEAKNRSTQTIVSRGVTYSRVYGGSSWSAWTEAISNKADKYTSSVTDLNTLLGKGIFQGTCKASSNAYCPTTDSSTYSVLSISFDSTHCMQMAILYHGYGTQKTYVRQYLNSWSSWVQL